MRKYEINSDTLALIPINKNKTMVYENKEYFIIEDSISSIMDDNCRYYGSDIRGRKKGTYSLVGFAYKAPIILSEEQEIIFFPTCSPRLSECAWINAANINKILPKPGSSEINFINNETIKLDVSYNIIQNQYFKSLSLESALKKRKKYK